MSEITGLKPYVLRYWETEFANLSPAKNRAGNRVYTEKNIGTILEIKRLLYQEKFTIEGARQHFKNSRGGKSAGGNASASSRAIRQRELARKALRDVQDSLAELVEYIRKQK